MLTYALIGLAGGLITGVSPCVLPMLPIIFFAAGANEGEQVAPRGRVVAIIAGLITGFSVFTLLGSALLSSLGLPDDFLRWVGVVVLSAVGLGMLYPPLGHLLERPFYRLPKVTGRQSGPFLLGLGLGTLYVPCAGPVLAAITVAAASGDIRTDTVVMTVSFALGAALPLLAFAAAGARIRTRIAAFQARARSFQIVGGTVLLALALALGLNVTSALQRAVPNYTKPIEDRLSSSDAVDGALTPFATAENRHLSRCVPGASTLADCGSAPPLRNTGRWFNTPANRPLTLAGLQGRIVLLDFFAYSCINCQRDQPYIEQWSRTYRDSGLTVLGIHSPEFAFERDADNLAAALRREDTTYPVVQDNQLATWTAYRNRYWPAKYLVDHTGKVRAIKFGEGDYAQTETLLRQLLAERPAAGRLPAAVTDAADVTFTPNRTPELYVADNRPGYVGRPKYIGTGVRSYSFGARPQPLDTYGLAGQWETFADGMTAQAEATLRLHFRAKEVYHVLGGNGTVTVSRPGQPDRVLTISGPPRLYRLVRGSRAIEDTLTLSYRGRVQAYTFTFG